MLSAAIIARQVAVVILFDREKMVINVRGNLTQPRAGANDFKLPVEAGYNLVKITDSEVFKFKTTIVF